MQDSVARLNAALSGRYRVERQLGEGGMATVYLADDLRHGRKVALKVLKPELAAVVGAERFLAEIRTTANLQHPHILPLFDSGEAGGLLYYVMPGVEGESLRERLDRQRQLPVDEAVRIATNVAEALDYAHRHGVIHRDIKPANILLLDGKPVVADFGIALAVSSGSAGRMTETGLSLGTPHYMSPEQATGDQSVGPAADIWALGCVLYEMLVGEPPYTGSTPQAVLGKIITAEPPSASEIRKSVPPNVDATIRKALEKVPADRFASGEAFVGALANAAVRSGEREMERRSRPVMRLPLVMGAMTFAAILGIAAARSSIGGRTEPVEPRRFVIPAPSGMEIVAPLGLAISPDERSIIFAGGVRGSEALLFRRDLRRLEAVPVAGTGYAWMPFYSPDGSWIAFFDQGENTLERVRPDGSDLQTLATAPASGRSGRWGDGTIVFNSTGIGGLVRIPESGGEPELATPDSVSLAWIDLLPGGEAVVGSTVVNEERQVMLVVLGTGETRALFPGTMPQFARDHLVYWRDGTVWAVRFDPDSYQASGAHQAIAQGVGAGTNALAWFAVSENLLIYQAGALVGIASGTPVWIDREGNREPLPVEPGRYAWPRISPDGSKVALVRVDQQNEDVWILDLATRTQTRLTFDPASDYGPVWFPDGRRVAFHSVRDGSSNLYARRVDGAGEDERLTVGSTDQRAYAVTPDGRALIVDQTDSITGLDLWSIGLDGDVPSALVRATAGEDTQVSLSPDGRFVAYQSSEEGYPEIWVQSLADPGRWMISTLDIAPASGIPNADPREARSPVWSRDGTEIFYTSGDALVRVPVSTEGAFVHGTPEVVLRGVGFVVPSRGPQYDVSPDGERFLVIELGGPEQIFDELIVVENWAAELNERVED